MPFSTFKTADGLPCRVIFFSAGNRVDASGGARVHLGVSTSSTRSSNTNSSRLVGWLAASAIQLLKAMMVVGKKQSCRFDSQIG